VLTLQDRDRFRKSREVGSYVGLRPKRGEAGDLGTEGQQPPAGALIDRDTDLYCQSTTAKLLVSAKILRSACRVFRLHMLREDAND
jgi:hypothetical protein